MKLQSIILTILFLSINRTLLPCDCDFQGGFLKVAPTTDLVALVKVRKYLTFKNIYNAQTPMSMEVEIIDIYKGKESRKTIIIWGDNGILCRPYLSQFDIEKYYVIALYNDDCTKGYVPKEEKETDYFVSICGEFWLSANLVKQIATSSDRDNKTPISLSDIKTKLLK
jgi:hypothetical protein